MLCYDRNNCKHKKEKYIYRVTKYLYYISHILKYNILAFPISNISLATHATFFWSITAMCLEIQKYPPFFYSTTLRGRDTSLFIYLYILNINLKLF